MIGSRIARASLRIDALYCVALGIMVSAGAPVTSSPLGLPAPVLMAVGAGTAIWGVGVWFAVRAYPLRECTRLVMTANIVASLGLAATGLVAGQTVLAVAATVLAIDVAAFAASQGFALRLIRLTA